MVAKVLGDDSEIREIAQKYKDHRNFLYLGRGIQFPVALEGALKLKEISYIHAEGYPAAEMKHGPIALIDENMPVVFIAPRDEVYGKIISNMQEVRARNGRIIAIAFEGDDEIRNYADHVIHIPPVRSIVSPLLTVDPAAAAGVPYRRPARMQRGPAQEPGKKRDGRIGPPTFYPAPAR